MIYSEEQCQLLTFSDITTLRTLEVEQAKTESLKLVNRSVSHEMLGPLMSNVSIAKLLLQTTLNENQMQMVKSIMASSQLVMCFTNDLIDNSFLENGSFRPMMQFGSPSEAISDIIQIVQGDAEIKKLKCVLVDDIVKNW